MHVRLTHTNVYCSGYVWCTIYILSIQSLSIPFHRFYHLLFIFLRIWLLETWKIHILNGVILINTALVELTWHVVMDLPASPLWMYPSHYPQKFPTRPRINMSTLFDTHYYRVTKVFCSIVGLWPYQSQHQKRIILSLNIFILFSYIPPQVKIVNISLNRQNINMFNTDMTPIVNRTKNIL